jgi:hypothetical protein
MAKKRADSDRRGWFARWRARSKQRADGISRRVYGESSTGAERHARRYPPGY